MRRLVFAMSATLGLALAAPAFGGPTPTKPPAVNWWDKPVSASPAKAASAPAHKTATKASPSRPHRAPDVKTSTGAVHPVAVAEPWIALKWNPALDLPAGWIGLQWLADAPDGIQGR